MAKVKEYIFNPRSKALHYRGYCPYVKGESEFFRYYDTEDEAVKAEGKALHTCKTCMDNREKKNQKYL